MTDLLLITGGRLSVRVPVGDQESKRLATLKAGMLVGELAFLGRERRTADIEADTEVEAYVLLVDDFDTLAAEDPAVTTVFRGTLLRIVADVARRRTDEVVELAG
jgi:CRP-like cAMP-binding protein